MYPEGPTKDWWGKPCWLNPLESDPDVVQGLARWSNWISDLAWSRLGVEQAELSQIAVDRSPVDVPPQPSLEDNRAWKWMKLIRCTLVFSPVFKSAQLASEQIP